MTLEPLVMTMMALSFLSVPISGVVVLAARVFYEHPPRWLEVLSLGVLGLLIATLIACTIFFGPCEFGPGRAC